jgi:hypothetical protein
MIFRPKTILVMRVQLENKIIPFGLWSLKGGVVWEKKSL